MENSERDPKKIAEKVMEKRRITNAIRYVKIARGVVFAIAGLQLISSLFTYYTQNGTIEYLIGGIVGMAVFLTLGFLSKPRPYLGLGLALGIYLASVIYIHSTTNIPVYTGILWKILIITGLVNGLLNVRYLPKQKESSNSTLDDALIDS